MFDFCGLLFFARRDDGRKITGSSARGLRSLGEGSRPLRPGRKYETVADAPMSDHDALPISWRSATAADAAFCFSVYAGTRAEELAAWGWGAAQQEMFLKMQF